MPWTVSKSPFSSHFYWAIYHSNRNKTKKVTNFFGPWCVYLLAELLLPIEIEAFCIYFLSMWLLKPCSIICIAVDSRLLLIRGHTVRAGGLFEWSLRYLLCDISVSRPQFSWLQNEQNELFCKFCEVMPECSWSRALDGENSVSAVPTVDRDKGRSQVKLDLRLKVKVLRHSTGRIWQDKEALLILSITR